MALAQARAALAFWGGTQGAPRAVKVRENMVFEARLASGAHVALRLHRPGYQSRAAIEAELLWTGRLAAAGMAVPEPVLALDGALTAQAGDRVASVVGWLDGVALGSADEPLAGDLAEQAHKMAALGAMVADLHNRTDALGLGAGLERPSWDAAGFCGEAPLWGRFWESPALDPEEQALMRAAREMAATELAAVLGEAADYGLIHADVLRENVLLRPEGMALIDFDDAGYGFRLYDLGTALVQACEEPGLGAQAEALVRGYRGARALSDAAAARLPLFVALRSFASSGWIVSRTTPDDPRLRLYARRALRMARHLLDGTRPWGG